MNEPCFAMSNHTGAACSRLAGHEMPHRGVEPTHGRRVSWWDEPAVREAGNDQEMPPPCAYCGLPAKAGEGCVKRADWTMPHVPGPHPVSAEPEKPEKRPEVPRKRPSNRDGSGQVYLVSEVDAYIKYVEAELAGLRESRKELEDALKYPRYGTTADLLRSAAKALDHYAAGEGEDVRSFITPHMKRAADVIDAALANVAKLTELKEGK